MQMKYNFVFDKDFLGNKTFCLSNMERFIVLAAVVGGHNVALSGYHTERLVSAIKYLRDKNSPFVSVESNIEYNELIGTFSDSGLKQGFVTDADGGVLHFSNLNSQGTGVISWLQTVMSNGWIKLCNSGEVRTLPAKFQLIAENCDCNGTEKYCDIIFKCNEDDLRQLWTLNELQRQIRMTKGNQHLRSAIGGKNCDFKDTFGLKLSSNAKDMVSEQSIGIETLRLARTIADIYGHNLTFCSDIETAKCLQNISA
jgi:hypothetical protein